ncbi:EAL domain-containing protein [Algiphilus sp.]|uniref:EAL domain-containing protein n=1 Tax=Algiphilus sp. TaxID=1872431 RepID=UPI003B51ABC4
MAHGNNNYEVLAAVYDSPRTRVSRARNLEDGALFLLKSPQAGQGTERVEAAYQKELRYRSALHPEQDEIRLERRNGLPLLVIRDDGSRALREWMESGGVCALADWLDIAIGASHELKRLHAMDVIHRDIHPGNILWDPVSRNVRLIDFELAVPGIHAQAEAVEARTLEGALPYMAPEMSGRMRIGVDHRSDLYALGATLYELLVGARPFAAVDAMELIHQHIAVQPVAPSEHCEDVPKTISEIVLKLLAKSPDARYQSARGLHHDLVQVRDALQRGEALADIPLGQRDVSDRYRPGTRLFGREVDRQALLASFKGVQSGRSRLHVIQGQSGTGKTSLARALREPAILAGGVFAEGKCDQFQRLQPYTAWVGALESAVAQWLARPQRQRLHLRSSILSAVGANGRLLTDLIPGLDQLIGEQPEVAALGPAETQRRLRYVFVHFLVACARDGGPLVLVLDDLQWMDTASLELLDALLRTEETMPLLLLVAFRDNEVDASHPLSAALHQLEEALPGVVARTMLCNLKLPDIQALVLHRFKVSDPRALELATVVQAKTDGNPFFCHQLLKQLCDTRVVFFDEQLDGWNWSQDALQAVEVSEDVVTLLIDKLHQLPGKTQSLLARMACLGNRCPLATLARVAELPPASVLQRLEPALQDYLITRDEQELHFSHDRVQQAAYALLSSKDKRLQHLRIARLLSTDEADLAHSAVLLDVVSHYEHAESLLSDTEERAHVALLSACAARRAQAASAHDVALRYFRFALALYGEPSLAERDAAFTELYLDAIQSEFNNAHHDRVASMLVVAEAQVATTLARVRLVELKIRFAIAGNDQNAAIALAIEALTLLGISIADDDDGLAQQAQDLQADLHWTQADIVALEALPEMRDEAAMAAMRIMVNAAGAAYVMRPALWRVLTLQMVHTTLTHGHSALGAFAFAFYGVLLAGFRGEIESGYAFGRLANVSLERFGAEPMRAKIINLFDVFVRHWKEHLRNSLESLPRGLQSGIDHGDFEYGSYNGIQHGKHLFFCGEPLDAVLEHHRRTIQTIEKLRMGYHRDFAHVWQQLARNLNGQADDPLVLRSLDYDAEALLPRLLAESSHFLVFNIHCSQAMLHYLLGTPQKALEMAERALPYQANVPGMAELAQHNFFHSLSLLACTNGEDAARDRDYRRQVARNQRVLGVWARHAPMNFHHKLVLVTAERLRRSRQPQRAARWYEAAIAGARAHYYLNDQALASECYAGYLRERGHLFLAANALREAIRLYRQWQAHAKVRQLNERYAEQFGGLSESSSWSSHQSVDGLPNLDVQAVLRSSLLIANESDVPTLKRQLMKVVAANAGAERGVLALLEEEYWVVAARYDEAAGGSFVEDDVALDACPDVPRSLLRSAIRHGRSVVLHDAASSSGFEHDPYIQSHSVRSAVCVPLRHGDAVTGVLYLENRSAPGVFPEERVRIIEILAAQAGVAVEKARLLQQMESRVELRTRELRDAKRQLEHANEELRASEERFRLAMVGSGEGLFDWDLRSNAMYLSPGWKQMLGYQDHELVNAYENWHALVDPEQWEPLLANIRAHLDGDSDCFEVEYRMAHKDGSWVLVLNKAHIVRGADGVPQRVVGTHFDVTGERNAQARVAHQALHDSLTGLPNRALFQQRLEAARARLAADGIPYVLHLLDLDRFKQRNDAFGHQVGDRILSVVAERILRTLRAGDFVARLGGDEFAVIQHGVDHTAEAQQLALRLIAAINKPMQVQGVTTDVGCSVGIRIVTDKNLSAETVIEQADAALYQSKARGGDVETLHCLEALPARERERQLVRELPAALGSGQLFLAFQPEIHFRDGHRSGVECLLRWRHPRFGVLHAGAFVAAMETHGHAARLLTWVVRAAAEQAHRWMAEKVVFGQISVNITSAESLTVSLAEQLLAVMRDCAVDPSAFKFELGAGLSTHSSVHAALAVLRRAGCTLCLQDFGAAAVAIADLPAMGIRQVKLAPALMRDIVSDGRARQVVRAAIDMAQALDIAVVATMVEAEAQRAALAECGCEWGQGTLVGAPAPAAEHAAAVARLH